MIRAPPIARRACVETGVSVFRQRSISPVHLSILSPRRIYLSKAAEGKTECSPSGRPRVFPPPLISCKADVLIAPEVLDGCPSHFLIKLPCSRARRSAVVHPSRFLIRLPPDLLKDFSVADMTFYVWRREATGAQGSPNTERSTTD